MNKQRSLTPRLAALLNLDPPFGTQQFKRTRVRPYHYMPSVPFKISNDPNSMDLDALSYEVKGILRLEDQHVVLEFRKSNPFGTGKRSGIQQVHVPLRDIEDIAFTAIGWTHWRNRIRIRFASLIHLEAFPHTISSSGELVLDLPFRHRGQADDLVQAIKLAKADAILEDAEQDAQRPEEL